MSRKRELPWASVDDVRACGGAAVVASMYLDICRWARSADAAWSRRCGRGTYSKP